MKRTSFNNSWRCNGIQVTLPHDAQISEKRSADASNGGHGYFPGGIYTYEKKFTAPAEWADMTVLVEFEGIYKNATVSLNGKQISFHPYGYTGFFVELTDLNYGGENVLTVVADNSKLPNSRWYTGSGIYRPVWLHTGPRNSLRPESVTVRTLSCAPAKICVETPMPCKIEILDGEAVIASGEGQNVELDIPDAKLWDNERPNLYICRVSNGEDELEEVFGIRMIEWSGKGLFINGKETLLRGGCVHHDSGILGAATYAESEERRVRIMKEAGFNAIRSSHNPASKALLDACDRYGMYVMDETFDMWYNRKNPYDYGCDFNDWWKKDVAAMVLRDKNHPSVIMYSIGNEVAEPFEQRGIDTGKAIVELIHRLDNTRPVTCGANLMVISRAAKGNGIYQDGESKTGAEGKKQKKESQNASLAFNIIASFVGSGMNKGGNSPKVDALTTPFLDSLDIAGYNYGSGRYPLEEKAHPDRVIFGSETFPQDIWKNWQMVKKYPYLIGDFMWTSWDYLGEAGIGAWSYTGGMPFNRPYPWVLAGAGVIDILGIPDGSCRYAATVWGLEDRPVIAVRPVNHPGVRVSKSVWRGTNAIESWAWRGCDGNKATVEVFSDAAAVELLLNGKSLGRKKIKECRAVFKTRYAAGTLTAVAYDAAGHETGRSELVSAAEALSVAVKPERTAAGHGEVVYVPVTIEDADGTVESNADRRLTVTVEGGELLAFGSANPCTEEQYHTGSFTTYHGRALAIVRTGDADMLSIVATDGVQTANAVIRVQ
uniref:Beta-galactosidase n=1 Tax=uncultured bacterium scaffold00056 TaxID=1132475 RepID=I7ARL2_9BACT|nr:beta-galactosidase [uncultured bacterium scaffold00056]